MILDEGLQLFNNHSLVGLPFMGPGAWNIGGANPAPQVVDLGANSDIGRGTEVGVQITVTEGFTSDSSAARLHFLFQFNDDPTLNANTATWATGLLAASAAGAVTVELPYIHANPIMMALGATYTMRIPVLSAANGMFTAGSVWNADGTAKWRKRYMGLVVLNNTFGTFGVLTGKITASVTMAPFIGDARDTIYTANFKVKA